MTFKADLKSDMETEFLDTDEFAESISYTPKGSAAVTIPAIVERPRKNSDSQEQSRILRKSAVIVIHNDANNGVASVNTKGDRVSMPAVPGGDNVEWSVVDIIDSSNAFWKLQLNQ